MYLPHPEIYSAEPGNILLVDDGRLRFRVRATGHGWIETEALVDGVISNRKGVNVPDIELGLAALSDKDRRDLSFGLDLGVNWVALSFVQRPEDVIEAKKLIAGRAVVMAKIEKPIAVSRIEEIIEVADGVMIARGDLGVELPPEQVPVIQKRIVHLSREAGKPVVVATQMLDSMVTSSATMYRSIRGGSVSAREGSASTRTPDGPRLTKTSAQSFPFAVVTQAGTTPGFLAELIFAVTWPLR